MGCPRLARHHGPCDGALRFMLANCNRATPMRRTSTWCRTYLIPCALMFVSACFPMATAPDWGSGSGDLCAQKDVVTSVKLQPSELTLAVGETAQLTATLNNGEFMLCAPQ